MSTLPEGEEVTVPAVTSVLPVDWAALDRVPVQFPPRSYAGPDRRFKKRGILVDLDNPQIREEYL